MPLFHKFTRAPRSLHGQEGGHHHHHHHPRTAWRSLRLAPSKTKSTSTGSPCCVSHKMASVCSCVLHGAHAKETHNPKFGKLFLFSSCERLAFRAAVICRNPKVCPQQSLQIIMAELRKVLERNMASVEFGTTWRTRSRTTTRPVKVRRNDFQALSLAISRSIFRTRPTSSWDGLPVVANPSVMPQASLTVSYSQNLAAIRSCNETARFAWQMLVTHPTKEQL